MPKNVVLSKGPGFVAEKIPPVPAVRLSPHSIGPAGADFPFARHVWTRTSGACPATILPGSVLTVENGTDSGISDFSDKQQAISSKPQAA
jgi:hypothetical protein